MRVRSDGEEGEEEEDGEEQEEMQTKNECLQLCWAQRCHVHVRARHEYIARLQVAPKWRKVAFR